jgi:hypothetical protein
LTVHDVGLVVFNETHSYSDRPESNEPVTSARQKLAHVVMNGDQKYGPDRQKHASTALPIEPSNEVLDNKSSHAAYDSSMKAAREAYLDGNDPTDGALYSIQRPARPVELSLQERLCAGSTAPDAIWALQQRISEQAGSFAPYMGQYVFGGVDSVAHFPTTMFLADSMQTACISPFRSGSSGQTSKSAKIQLFGGRKT